MLMRKPDGRSAVSKRQVTCVFCVNTTCVHTEGCGMCVVWCVCYGACMVHGSYSVFDVCAVACAQYMVCACAVVRL